jgi:hypothetical protein
MQSLLKRKVREKEHGRRETMIVKMPFRHCAGFQKAAVVRNSAREKFYGMIVHTDANTAFL